MRQFLKLTISFFIAFSTLLYILIVSTEYTINKKADFGLNPNVKYLVLGHSHPECAFNDSLIYDFKNLSQSGESFYYTYFKIKEIIKHNPSIEVVFIEFENSQINESMNNWIWQEKYMNYRYPKYAPFMNFSDEKLLIKNNFSGYLNSISLSFKNNIGRIIDQNFNYSESIGGYLHLERNKTDSLLNTMKDIHSPLSENKKISEYNLKYLTRIINFCEKQGKKVILIRSPLHEKYSGYINEQTYQQIRDLHYSSVEYLDFSKFPLSNSEFGDLEHLNHKGAKVFSNYFATLLSNEFIEKNNKQELINEEIKSRRRYKADK